MYANYFLWLCFLCSSLTTAIAVPETSTRQQGGRITVRQVPNKSFKARRSGSDALARAYAKYGFRWEGSSNARRDASFAGRGSGQVATNQDGDLLQFLSEVQYGTPPQTLTVNFDTGSADNIVFSSDTPPDQVQGQTIFDITKSKTAKPAPGLTFNASFGDGSAALGIVVTDTVSIGGIAVTNMAVESMTSASAEFTNNTDVDAIMGFAFSKLNQVRPTKQQTWFEKAAPGLAENLFTANLKQGEPGNYNFGFIDQKEFTGDIKFVPLNTTKGFWQFRADGFAVNQGKEVCSPHDAFVDTGSSFTLLPPDIADAYYADVKGSANTANGFTVPCNAVLPDFTMIVDKFQAVVPGKFLQTTIAADDSNSTCLGGIQLQPPNFVAVYGDNFMFAQLVVFDAGKERIGFASKLK